MNDNEKVYKTMSFAGVISIVMGVIAATVGITVGILNIVSGAKLLKNKKEITF